MTGKIIGTRCCRDLKRQDRSEFTLCKILDSSNCRQAVLSQLFLQWAVLLRVTNPCRNSLDSNPSPSTYMFWDPRTRDFWSLDFLIRAMEIMYVKHLAYCQIPARCFQPESIIKLTSKPCSSPYLTHVRKCHFHSFVIYIKNPGIILSYTLIPSTSTPASLASSHTSGPLYLLSLYPEHFHQTLSRCGHMLLHCTECVLSSAYVW